MENSIPTAFNKNQRKDVGELKDVQIEERLLSRLPVAILAGVELVHDHQLYSSMNQVDCKAQDIQVLGRVLW